MINSNKKVKPDFVSPSALDDRLMADKDGKVKKEIIKKLEGYAEKVKKAMNKGDLAPNQFEAAVQISEAIKQAQAIIQDRLLKDHK